MNLPLCVIATPALTRSALAVVLLSGSILAGCATPLSWLDAREDDAQRLGAGCVIANEVLDALPTHRVVARGGKLFEVFVDLDDRGDLVNVERDPSTPELLKMYHVSFVLIGPQELSPLHGANASYWAQHGTLVYDNGEYRVYRVAEPESG